MVEEKLIEAVKRYRELYDTNHVHYMKTNLKKKIWNGIAKELNFKDGEEAKCTWLKLRGSYRDARRRQMKYRKSGIAAEKLKMWRFQKQMSFLDRSNNNRNNTNNYNNVPSDADVIDDSDNDWRLRSKISPLDMIGDNEFEWVRVEDVDAENYNNNNINDQDDQDDDNNNNNENVEGSDRTVTECSSKPAAEEAHCGITTRAANGKLLKKLKLAENFQSPSNTKHNNIIKMSSEECNSNSNNQENGNDALFNFFLSMYQFTKDMPPVYQRRIRDKLYQAVSQAEEEIVVESSSSRST